MFWISLTRDCTMRYIYLMREKSSRRNWRQWSGIRLGRRADDEEVDSVRCGGAWHGDLLSGIFAKDAEVVAASWDYLKAYAIDCLFTCFLFCFIGFFNGMEYTRFVMVQEIVGAFLVRIPVSYLMSRRDPVSLFHIGMATPCSTVVQIVLCFICMFYLRKRLRKNF